MGRHNIGSIEDLPAGESLGTVVDGLEVAVFNVDGELYAIQNKCIHKQGPLYQGETDCGTDFDSDSDSDSCSVYCPYHYWEFDLESGEYVVDDSKQLRTFDVDVDDGEIWVEI